MTVFLQSVPFPFTLNFGMIFLTVDADSTKGRTWPPIARCAGSGLAFRDACFAGLVGVKFPGALRKSEGDSL